MTTEKIDALQTLISAYNYYKNAERNFEYKFRMSLIASVNLDEFIDDIALPLLEKLQKESSK